MKSKFLIFMLFCVALLSSHTAFAWSEVFTDDFSSGDLSKWTADTAFTYDAESGGMKTGGNGITAKVNMEAQKNISFQFDITVDDYLANHYIVFECPEDSHKFKMHFKGEKVEFTNYFTHVSGDYWDTIVNWNLPSGTNTFRVDLLDGELSIYLKEGDTFSKKGGINYQDSHGLIELNKAYIPGIWVTSDAIAVFDNVIVKALPSFDVMLSSETIDTRPDSKLTINFNNAPTGTVNDDNIWLEKSNGTKISSVSKISDGVYELANSDWLSEGETLKVKMANIENAFGQKITSFEKDIQALTYTNDFTLQVMKAEGNERIPITELEQGNQTIAAKLLPNRPTAAAADITIILCKGTEEKYSISDIYYYNAVSVNSEKPAEITVGVGEFLKVMTFTDFTTGKIAGETVSIMQAE